MSELREWPRLRPVGISVEMDPFLVGRGVLERGGDCIVGVVEDWELPPLLRDCNISGAVVVYV